MKFSRLYAAFVAVVPLLFLYGCGGSGGGGDTTPVAAAPTAPGTVTVECPNNKKSTAPTRAAAEAACPVVLPVSTTVAQGAIVSPVSFKGISVTMNGAIDTPVVVLLDGGGNAIGGAVSISDDDRTLIFVPTMRLSYGESFLFVAEMEDSIGRNIQVSIAFSTIAMSCVNSAVWSNPATFSAPLHDCVAPIGVQALVTPANTLQDNSCSITVGTPLSAACHMYLANGTMLLANTGIVVNGHAVTWMVFVGTDGKAHIVLLDTNDLTSPIPLGTMALSNPLLWEIGNPTGESISINTGVAGNETDLVTWDVTTSALKRTCLVRCS